MKKSLFKCYGRFTATLFVVVVSFAHLDRAGGTDFQSDATILSAGARMTRNEVERFNSLSGVQLYELGLRYQYGAPADEEMALYFFECAADKGYSYARGAIDSLMNEREAARTRHRDTARQPENFSAQNSTRMPAEGQQGGLGAQGMPAEGQQGGFGAQGMPAVSPQRIFAGPQQSEPNVYLSIIKHEAIRWNQFHHEAAHSCQLTPEAARSYQLAQEAARLYQLDQQIFPEKIYKFDTVDPQQRNENEYGHAYDSVLLYFSLNEHIAQRVRTAKPGDPCHLSNICFELSTQRKDFKGMIELLRWAAWLGHSDALFELGLLSFCCGFFDHALFFWKHAAERCHPRGMKCYADMLFFLALNEPNFEKKLDGLQTAARFGNVDAVFILDSMPNAEGISVGGARRILNSAGGAAPAAPAAVAGNVYGGVTGSSGSRGWGSPGAPGVSLASLRPSTDADADVGQRASSEGASAPSSSCSSSDSDEETVESPSASRDSDDTREIAELKQRFNSGDISAEEIYNLARQQADEKIKDLHKQYLDKEHYNQAKQSIEKERSRYYELAAELGSPSARKMLRTERLTAEAVQRRGGLEKNPNKERFKLVLNRSLASWEKEDKEKREALRQQYS
jgi:TPR repeat protein